MNSTVIGSSLEQELSVLGLVDNEESLVSVASKTGAEAGIGDFYAKHSNVNVNVIDDSGNSIEEEGSQFVSLSSVWQQNSYAKQQKGMHITLVSLRRITLYSSDAIDWELISFLLLIAGGR